MLRARTVEPEKQPLLVNGSETFVSRQRLGKNVPATTDTHVTIEVLLETVFSTRSVQRGYRRTIDAEAGSNTSTVTLQVAGDDKKGSLESEIVKYGYESHGTRTRE
jgi:hypothetical protein